MCTSVMLYGSLNQDAYTPTATVVTRMVALPGPMTVKIFNRLAGDMRILKENNVAVLVSYEIKHVSTFLYVAKTSAIDRHYI